LSVKKWYKLVVLNNLKRESIGVKVVRESERVIYMLSEVIGDRNGGNRVSGSMSY